MLLRKDLRMIYLGLSNEEKNTWANIAGYTAPAGLNRYLKAIPNGIPYNRLLDSLKATVGEAKFEQLVSNVQNSNNTELNITDNSFNAILNNLKTEFIPLILNNNNLEDLQSAQNIFETALILCKNQIQNITLVNNINE